MDTVENDTLKFISQYFKTSKNGSNIYDAKNQINEAFSGGGAWDEDDERSELYEKKTDIYKFSAAIDSKDHFVEDAVVLNFGNSIYTSKRSDYHFISLPDVYTPIQIKIDESLGFSPESKLSHNQESNVNLVEFSIEDADDKTASAALKGFMPFNDDPEKQSRYTRYLRYCIDKIGKADISKSSLYLDEKEREEFIMSAQIFKPSSSIISARFETSSTPLQPRIQLKAGLSRLNTFKKPHTIPEVKSPIKDQIEEDLLRKSGPNRTSYVWIPKSLLCKRFNITPPETGMVSLNESKKVKPILADESVERMVNMLLKDSKNKTMEFESKSKDENIPTLPTDDLFDEIFGSSSSIPNDKLYRARAIDHFENQT